jgi:hypothetical protein
LHSTARSEQTHSIISADPKCQALNGLETGIDYLASGAITHSAPNLDNAM